MPSKFLREWFQNCNYILKGLINQVDKKYFQVTKTARSQKKYTSHATFLKIILGIMFHQNEKVNQVRGRHSMQETRVPIQEMQKEYLRSDWFFQGDSYASVGKVNQFRLGFQRTVSKMMKLTYYLMLLNILRDLYTQKTWRLNKMDKENNANKKLRQVFICK